MCRDAKWVGFVQNYPVKTYKLAWTASKPTHIELRDSYEISPRNMQVKPGTNQAHFLIKSAWNHCETHSITKTLQSIVSSLPVQF